MHHKWIGINMHPNLTGLKANSTNLHMWVHEDFLQQQGEVHRK